MEPTAHVHNISKFVQGIGPHLLKPGEGAEVAQQLVTPFLRQLHEAGVLSIREQVPAEVARPAQKVVAVEPEPPKIESAADSWRSMHHNACLAWIRRCDAVEQLEAILADEGREKIRAALEARIAALGEPR